LTGDGNDRDKQRQSPGKNQKGPTGSCGHRFF
jgi:hypothetical protein